MMFNFRAFLNSELDRTEDVLGIARTTPLPGWRPPPH
jgi:hypothetical protein